MSTTTASYKETTKIKDDKFDVDKLHQYNLMVQLGVRDVQVVVVDSTNNQCLLLEDFILSSVKSPAAYIDILRELFEDHHLLMAGFWKNVRISIKNSKFSLVPSSLFVKEAVYDYLKLNTTVNTEKEEILYYRLIKSDAICVFAVNRDLSSWLKTLYPNAEIGFIHQSCSLIEGVSNFEKSNKKNTLYLYIDRFKLHIITLKNNKLEYYNQFSIKHFNDYVRYIMLVMKGLHKKQQHSDVVLWGYIGKESAHYKEFYKFIKNISFGDRPGYLKFGYVFDEVQDHHYFDLYSTHLCD